MPLWGRLHAVFVYATEGILKLCGKSGKKASAPKCPPPHPPPPHESISSLCGSIWDGVALVTTLCRLNVFYESLSAAEKWSARKQREYSVDCIVSTDLLPVDVYCQYRSAPSWCKTACKFQRWVCSLFVLKLLSITFRQHAKSLLPTVPPGLSLAWKWTLQYPLEALTEWLWVYTYLVFTRMPGESYRRRFRSLLLYSCDVFRALINCHRLLIVHKRSRPFWNVGC